MNPAPPAVFDYRAALLSYLFPGLGQVVQGRVAKGLLFFVCLYGLFFYGLWMGQAKNVWLKDAKDLPPTGLLGIQFGGVLKAAAYRPQYLGQFGMGVAAWPALAQYFAGSDDPAKKLPLIGSYMRAPSEDELNDLQREHHKKWDLAWVYTVIAGVLNFLVIYDALAGPVVRDDETPTPTTPPAGGAA
jgi:hypothetical protein